MNIAVNGVEVREGREQIHPPRPRLVLRIGVTAHRPGASLPASELGRVRAQVADLVGRAAKTVHNVQEQHRFVYSAEPPLMVAVSALAEGGDRIFAEEALRAGCQLDVVLPFARDIYEQDFGTPESRERFRDLTARARAVFEIDSASPDDDRSAAYEAAGLVMLDHVDLVIAIWDGGASGGRGGTREIIDEALRRNIPIIWISSAADRAPAQWRHRVSTPLFDGTSDAFAALIMETLRPPGSALDETSKSEFVRLKRFLTEEERSPAWWTWAHDLLLRLLIGKPATAPRRIADRQNEWHGFIDALPPKARLGTAIDEVLQRRFLWADRKAAELGRLYRSAYVLGFAFAALAVLVGLLTILQAWNTLFGGNIAVAKTVSAGSELFFIALVIVIATAGRRGRWHERFLDVRALAEMLRHARILAPIGRVGRILSGTAAPGESEHSWTIWYARATIRELPLPNARADATYLRESITAVLHHEVAGQIDYHHNNHKSLEKAHHRLDKAGEVLFYMAIFMCLLWFTIVAIYGFQGADHTHWISHTLKSILTFLGAVLPAFASALAGIRGQGDFRASAQQSVTTEKKLSVLLHRAETRMPEYYPEACGFLEAVADAMNAELGQWRLLFSYRPLPAPG